MENGDKKDSSLFRVGDNVELWHVLVNRCVLVQFIILFEQCLHCASHHIQRNPKYHEMVNKVYGELMILGLIGLGIKILKEVAHFDAYGKPMMVFQAADIMVFILAIALIIQAISIFVYLRSRNKQAAKAELITSTGLVAEIKNEQNKRKTLASRLCSGLSAQCLSRQRQHDETNVKP